MRRRVQRRLPGRRRHGRPRGDRRHVGRRDGDVPHRVSTQDRHRHGFRTRGAGEPRRADRRPVDRSGVRRRTRHVRGRAHGAGGAPPSRRPCHRVDRSVARRSEAILGHADRAAADVRRPGGHRDRERAPLQRAQRAHCAAHAIGGRIARIGRGGPGGQLDARSGHGPVDDRRAGAAIDRRRRRLDLRIRRDEAAIPAPFLRWPARRSPRSAARDADAPGRRRARPHGDHRRARRDPRRRRRARLSRAAFATASSSSACARCSPCRCCATTICWAAS